MQRTEVDLPLQLDRDDPRPLPVQVADGIRDLVDRGVLRPGERLPASRPLAQRWGVARGTVVAGVEQLVAEGYLTPVTGAGTVVNPRLAAIHPGLAAPHRRRRTPAPPRRTSPALAPGTPAVAAVDLSPGRPDAARIVDPRWREAWRVATAEVSASAPPPAGVPSLRGELASHLRQVRGVMADPNDLVVTTGARDGLTLVLQVVAAQRSRRLTVAVEDPGYPSLRRVPARLGARLVEVPVDGEGIQVAALRRLRRTPDLVIVTPSHQYPLGNSMSAARRRELLAWAGEHEVLVVEDDYDSELRYVGAPLPALAALDRQTTPDGRTVITLGSFSKTVSGDLGAGFVYAPRTLVLDLVRLRADLGGLPSGVVQRALAGYLHSGGLRRHIERMRRDYRRRRLHLLEVLADLPDAEVSCMDGGLHAVVHLGSGRQASAAVREEAVVGAAADNGVTVTALSRYWAHAGPTRSYGVVIGYPSLDEGGEAALARLRDVISTT